MHRVSSDSRSLSLSWSRSLHGTELYDGNDVGRFTTDWHFHEGWQLVAVTKGERYYEFPSSSVIARPGKLVLVPPCLVHRAHCFDAGNTSFQIATLPDVNLDVVTSATPLTCLTSRFFDSFLSMFESLNANGMHQAMHVLANLKTWVRESEPAGATPMAVAPDFVRGVESFLMKSFDSRSSLHSLSRLAGVSPYHLTHVFKKHVGLPPLAFQARAKLMKSRKLIAQGCSLAETSLSLNFSDQSHFGRQFRKVYGMTPGEYQRSLRSA